MTKLSLTHSSAVADLVARGRLDTPIGMQPTRRGDAPSVLAKLWRFVVQPVVRWTTA